MSYRKYDDSIKEMIIKSGNPNLFPELNIPRTTAMYWIRNSKRKVRIQEVNYDKALLDKIEKLEKELQEERLKNIFIRKLIGGLEKKDSLYSDKKNKEHVVKTILKFQKNINVSEMCNSVGLRPNKFYKLKIDVLGCPKVGHKACKIQAPNQLTFREQEKIFDLANDPKLSHLSVRGLQYFAFREGILTCGYDSWRKYVRAFRGDLLKVKTKKYRKGIRAKSPNEIWHIDVTEFKLKNGQKVYLQVLMDNFSRKIMNWKMSFNKRDSLTISNIMEIVEDNEVQFLMSDQGGENTSKKVKKLLHGKGITSLIAKKDVLFSNSMVESFFKILKNRFLNKFKRYKLSKLYRLIKRSVEYFNNSPMSVLKGATPIEMFKREVDLSELVNQFKDEVQINCLQRPNINRFCLRKKICV